MTSAVNYVNLNAEQVFRALDAKDGTDNFITKDIWKEFKQKTGVKARDIDFRIGKERGLISIKTYLKNSSQEVLQKIAKYCGIASSQPAESQTESVKVEKKTSSKTVDNNNNVKKTEVNKEKYPPAKNKHTTIDGVIDPSEQGETGDCWLLSGLQALAGTERGRKAIRDAINVQYNGDVIITLKGAYGWKKEFRVTAHELETSGRSTKYSYGDADTRAFELAIEKYRRQFGETLDMGGNPEEVNRLITGSYNTQIITTERGMQQMFNKMYNNPGKYSVGLGVCTGENSGHELNLIGIERDFKGRNVCVFTDP